MVTVLRFFATFIHLIQPLLVPICFLLAWALITLTVWSLWSAARDGVSRGRRMHQIPCSNCEFFTGDYRLKCTVHPSRALSEEAINCSDYDPKLDAYQKHQLREQNRY